ncbi:hypothetical protein [Burkholderia vietnamiensis]|uniref:hypothetical protein n=1 Tax=Burkholderia vietnamiensis TaxID=60552 RepID=UPI000A5692F6|nr:hypothetical protein [Burkholderia vietnamiensis]
MSSSGISPALAFFFPLTLTQVPKSVSSTSLQCVCSKPIRSITMRIRSMHGSARAVHRIVELDVIELEIVVRDADLASPALARREIIGSMSMTLRSAQ